MAQEPAAVAKAAAPRRIQFLRREGGDRVEQEVASPAVIGDKALNMSKAPLQVLLDPDPAVSEIEQEPTPRV